MSRKYRQQGYQDNNKGSERTRQNQRPTNFRDGPRSPRMPGLKKALKCAFCGTRLPLSFDEVALDSECSNCGADLHSCKHCVHFDPSSRFECTQPIKQRVNPKDVRADCEFFEIRTTVEKDVTSSQSRPSDARAAFEDLFKN